MSDVDDVDDSMILKWGKRKGGSLLLRGRDYKNTLFMYTSNVIKFNTDFYEKEGGSANTWKYDGLKLFTWIAHAHLALFFTAYWFMPSIYVM